MKLTLVTLMCRNKVISSFFNLPVFNGKTVIHHSTINKAFEDNWGFTPQRGETISFL